jgi:4-hydroxy-tetrahydrodipicolinate synthase
MARAAESNLKGWMTALVTPFKDGAIDESALRNLIDWQIDSGIQGLVPVGTTGESPTLSHEEHKRVVEIAIAEARGRVPVIAGAGSNNTREAIELAIHAEKAGASAVLVVTPYYNKPNQEGLFQHFRAIDAAVGIPIVIYNIPPRSVIDMSVDTMKRCYGELRNIVGVKDATGRAHLPAKAGDGTRFPAIFRRRHHGAVLLRRRRGRLHFGGLQCRAGPVRQVDERSCRG